MGRGYKTRAWRKAKALSRAVFMSSASSASSDSKNELEHFSAGGGGDEAVVGIDRQSVSIEQVKSIPLTLWKVCGDSVTGLAHRRKGVPCQDAVAFRNSPRPILALSDGAGSAVVSERGANTLVAGISRFLVSMDDALSTWLDDPADQSIELAPLWANRILVHAQGLIQDLSISEKRSPGDFRATLELAVIGAERVFWWQIGDGVVVVRNIDGLKVLGDVRKGKGEFANQTFFVDTASLPDVQYGVLPAQDVYGLALMSDGGAERLVASDGSRVGLRIAEWLDQLTANKLSPDKIALAFHEAEMWERTSLDDRSIVMVAR